MILSENWVDYELLDIGDGDKLERWGNYILQRPDPQAIWPKSGWDEPDARYIRSSSGGGNWRFNRRLASNWKISYPSFSKQLKFIIEPTGFKHTGLFPEQSVNWDYMQQKISLANAQGRQVRILNLFAYTGGATTACAAAGAFEVVHVDASKGMNLRAKDNVEISGLSDMHVRFFTDDVNKFVEREIRRGRKYDGIVMDPPSYGRGPSGELWKLEDALYGIVSKCSELLSDDALFFIINSYTTGLSPIVLSDILSLVVTPKIKGRTFADEIGIKATRRDIILPCGCTGRWESI